MTIQSISRVTAWVLPLSAVIILSSTAQLFAAVTPCDGMDMVATERYSEAEECFKTALETNPEDANIHASFSKLHIAQGNTKQGVEYAEKATSLAPRNVKYWTLLAIAYGERLDDVNIFSKVAIAKKIRNSLNKAIDLDPDNAEAHYLLAQYYIQSPGMFGGGLDKAEEEITILKRLDTARAARALVKVSLHLNKWEIAERHFLEAIKLDASHESRYEYGLFLIDRKRYEDAAEISAAGISYNPEYSENYYLLGRTILRFVDVPSKSQIKEGIDAMKHFISMPHSDWIDPLPYKWAHYRLGMLYGLAGEKSNEIDQYQQALKLDPDFAEAKVALAKVQ